MSITQKLFVMDALHLRQLPNNTNNLQDKLSKNLIESQEFLNRLHRLVEESKAFNKKALEYLVNSKSFMSQNLTKRVLSFVDNITLVSEDAPVKES